MIDTTYDGPLIREREVNSPSLDKLGAWPKDTWMRRRLAEIKAREAFMLKREAQNERQSKETS